MLDLCKGRAAADKQIVSAAFTSRIRHILDTQSFLKPELFYAFVRTLVFFAQYSPVDADTTAFLTRTAEAHPLIPLAYEVSYGLKDALGKLGYKFTKSANQAADVDAVKEALIAQLLTFPVHVVAAEKGTLQPAEFLNIVTDVLKTVGGCKRILREQLAEKIAHPPSRDTTGDAMCQFERSLRKGYSRDEMVSLLRVLMVWRSLTDYLRNYADVILKVICPYLYAKFQAFVKDSVEHILLHPPKKKEGFLNEMFTPLRETVGDWAAGEERLRKGRNLKPRELRKAVAAPHPCAIELVRIQLQHLTHAVKGQPLILKDLDKKDAEFIKTFLTESPTWGALLDLGALVEGLADQSDLFFREVQLDLNREELEKNRMSTFPIRSSLPFILGEFALKNFSRPELTELIFFPLGVYDDAARVAEYRLGSFFLANEIKFEAEMCVKNLAMLISEYTFGSFRSYATMRFLLPSVYNSLKRQLDQAGQWADSTPYRLSNLLQQNQFYLHCRQVDIKELISSYLEAKLQKAVFSLMKLAENYGLPQLVAVTRGLDIVRETHRLLSAHGFGLLPFDDILTTALGTATPTTYATNFVTSIIDHLAHKLSKNWYLRQNPLRLFPVDRPNLKSVPFGGGTIGVMLSSALGPVIKLVTVEHFSCLNRLLDDGSMTHAIQLFVHHFRQLATMFGEAYGRVTQFLTRIGDAPLATPGNVLFDRYEGAYNFLLEETQIMDLFMAMKRVGNLLAMANMMDIGLQNRKMTRGLVLGWLRELDLNLKWGTNVRATFGPQLADAVDGQDPLPTDRDVFPPVLMSCLSFLLQIVSETQKADFAETSGAIFEFETLTGFAARWSVLEYVFLLMEFLRKTEKGTRDLSPFELYGEGVLFTAAAIVEGLQQGRIYFATNIGRKLQRSRTVDPSARYDERFERFCGVEKLEATAFHWIAGVYRPMMQHLRTTGYLE
jgi:hypothetical protein